MTLFVDTSALFAFLDRSDRGHAAVVDAFASLADEDLVTNTYVVVESVALVGARLGSAAAVTLIDDVLPSIRCLAVDDALHVEALRAFRAAPGSISLVDRTSFAFMRREGIERALTVDSDFTLAGFLVIPPIG